MADIATIARPYAEALFRVAEATDLAAWSERVSELANVAAHPDVRAMAENPKLEGAQVAEVFLAALSAPVPAEVSNLVAILVENDRLGLLPEIAQQFHELKNARQGAADAEITSAFELSEAQVKEVVATLEQKFGRKLHPSVTVDSSLIGGVRVVVGDEVLDSSVRAKLQQMHSALTA